MPTYDVHCLACDRRAERMTTIARRRDPCEVCGGAVELEHRPSITYQPFTPYFDFALGVQVDSLADRWRHMRGTIDRDTGQRVGQMEYRDKVSPGDLSARRDRVEAQKREEARR